MIISYVNKKGGASKSTSVLNTAVTLQDFGHKTCIIDFDTDPTLYMMSQDVDLGIPVYIGDSDSVRKQIEELQSQYTHIVIDTPPNDEAIIMRVSSVSDEVIVPLAPTGFDMSRLRSTVTIVEEIEVLREKSLLSILVTRFRTGVKSNQAGLEEIQKRDDLPLLQSKTRFLDRYTIYDRPTSPNEEYEAILKELKII